MPQIVGVRKTDCKNLRFKQKKKCYSLKDFFSAKKKKNRGRQTGVGKMRAGPSTSRHLNKKMKKLMT